jgi:peptidoglycan hydrolase CwlO-like protein
MESKVKEENDSQLKILFEKTKNLESNVESIQKDLGKVLELLTKSKERNE